MSGLEIDKAKKTPTLIEDENGNIDIYGIAHKHNGKRE